MKREVPNKRKRQKPLPQRRDSSLKIKELENNREFNKIFDFAYKIDGGVKYFEKPADTQIINESDFIIYFSEEGKKSAEIISKISGATIKDFSKI